ncbi:MAG TPA: phosphotransferase [Diaminobutyricibacter sp.]
MVSTKPDDELLAWAIAAVAPGGGLVEARGLRDGGSPWLLRVRSGESERSGVLRLGAAGGHDTHVEAAALDAALAGGIAVPRVLASRLEPDPPLLLIEAVDGSSAIPVDRPTIRLRALGAAAARIHRTPPPAGLPRRTRSIAGVDFDALRRAAPPQPLLQRAEAVAARGPSTPAPDGFVHGDLWQGNTLWRGDELVSIIDWDCAGHGPAGVDLGSLRCDAAVTFGVDAAADVLDGWQEEAGRAAADVDYWDVVAALATPPDLGWFVDTIRSQRRPDLTRELLVERRDGFLRGALERLGEQPTLAPDAR